MEESRGGGARQGKRVALSRNGGRNCYPKDWCRPIPGAALRPRLSGTYDQDDVQLLKTYRVADATAAALQGQENARRDEGHRRTCNFDEVHCEKCERDDDDDQMLLCDGCDRGFHMYCLSPVVVSVPQGDWFCPFCSRAGKIQEFPKVQRKIDDFFRIQKLPRIIPSSNAKKRRRNSGGLTSHKKSRKLLVHTPSQDLERRLKQMASLATALTSVGVAFSDELTYDPARAPRSSNCPSIERDGMQVMGNDDKAAFDLSKALWRLGQCPPLMVTYDTREGFVVEADSSIKDMTIIAEYTGDVDFMGNRLNDEGNSIMGLLFTEDPANELVICPDKRGNIARFVSGINNYTSDGRKKQNVRCVRFDVEGEARALLIAIRDIPKGERLYYDYNGYQKDYPTKHFV